MFSGDTSPTRLTDGTLVPTSAKAPPRRPRTFLSHAAAFVRAVGVLLRSNTEAFWGELAGLAASLVNDELNAVAVRVQAKIAQARAALRLLTANGTNEVGSALAAAAELALHEEEPDVINLPCPVCRFDGWGVGAVVDEGDAEGEHDDGGITWHWLPDLYVLLDSFECHVCRLNLEGAEELDEAGVPLRVATDRATPGDALDAVRTNEAYYLS